MGLPGAKKMPLYFESKVIIEIAKIDEVVPVFIL
jgi:hypothetical protein